MISYSVWVHPADIDKLIDALDRLAVGQNEDGSIREEWKLIGEGLQEGFKSFGLIMGSTLLFGGDLKAPRLSRSQMELGHPVPGNVDARELLRSTSDARRPNPVHFVFSCHASDRPEGFEWVATGWLKVNEHELPSPSALGSHAELIADSMEYLSGPVFDAFPEGKARLRQVRNDLRAVAQYFNGVTLYDKFDMYKQDEEAAYKLISIAAATLADRLRDAVEAAPDRRAIGQKLYEIEMRDQSQTSNALQSTQKTCKLVGNCWNVQTSMFLTEAAPARIEGYGEDMYGTFTVKGTGNIEGRCYLTATNFFGDHNFIIRYDAMSQCYEGLTPSDGPCRFWVESTSSTDTPGCA